MWNNFSFYEKNGNVGNTIYDISKKLSHNFSHS